MLGSNQYYGGSESRQELAQALRTKKNKGDSMRILLIEDDISVAEFVVKGLKESGFSVDHTQDGKEGLLLASSESYDILVVDRNISHI